MNSDAALVDRRDQILEAMLPNVVFDGWSAANLDQAVTSLNLSPQELALAFPNGASEARLWLDDWADRQMATAIAHVDFSTLRLGQRIAVALKARLAVLAPYREAVRLAIGARLSPKGVMQASQAVYRTVDTIWYLVGDESVDFSFYTKRASLASVYGAAMFYWLNDTSDEAVDTSDFIDHHLKNVVRLPQMAREQALRTMRFFTAPFDLLHSGVRR